MWSGLMVARLRCQSFRLSEVPWYFLKDCSASHWIIYFSGRPPSLYLCEGGPGASLLNCSETPLLVDWFVSGRHPRMSVLHWHALCETSCSIEALRPWTRQLIEADSPVFSLWLVCYRSCHSLLKSFFFSLKTTHGSNLSRPSQQAPLKIRANEIS